VITQSNRPLAFFSRKLSVKQQKYSVTKIELLALVETLKKFKGMLWSQRIKVYTDHKNLTQDALRLTSDCVYRWRLILEEYGPEIVYIKGIHNTIADAISRLDFVSPDMSSDEVTTHQSWMTFSKCWCEYNEPHDNSTNKHNYSMNNVFANRSNKDEIYPLTVKEIAEAQELDRHFKATAQQEKYKKTLIENTLVFCKNGKLLIPGSLLVSPLSTAPWKHTPQRDN